MSHRNAGLAVYRGDPVGEGDWPAIVDRDLLDGVRAILTRKDRRIGGTSSGRKHLLSGLAVCGKCGQTMGSGGPSMRDWCRRQALLGVTCDMARPAGNRSPSWSWAERPDAAGYRPPTAARTSERERARAARAPGRGRRPVR